MAQIIKYDIKTGETIIETIPDKELTEEEIKQEEIKKIDEELASIDREGVNRHLENQIEASNTYDTIYESTRKLIDRKNELREQRKLLMGGASSGEDNINK